MNLPHDWSIAFPFQAKPKGEDCHQFKSNAIQRTFHPESRLLHDVGVDLRGRHILVPE